MIKLPVIHNDCTHFYGDRPCFPNKKYSIFCDGCEYYERDEQLSQETDIKLSLKPIDIIEYPKNFVIIKLDAVGDVLRTTSILPSIKARYPVSDLTWITKSNSGPVLKNNEYIDRIITVESVEFQTFINEHNTFDIAMNLDSGLQSCTIMKNIRASVCFGFTIKHGKPWPVNELANEWYLMGVNDNVKRGNRKTYHRIIHEICGLQYKNNKPLLFISEKIKKLSSKICDEFKVSNYDEFILVNLGGGNRWQNKKWTIEGYASVINQISVKYENKLTGIVAGQEDMDFYNEVTKIVIKRNNIAEFGCDNPIDKFIAIISAADKVLTSDSLGMHIATALDKFTVVLVGPTSYTELDVFGKGEVIHSDVMECKCYYSDVCTEEKNCMNTIGTEKVMQAIGL